MNRNSTRWTRLGASAALLLAFSTLSGAATAQEPMKPAAEAAATTYSTKVYASAEEAKPLAAGAMAPKLNVETLDGKTVNLGDLYAKGPTVLIFYRGGWCPFCSRHFEDLRTIEPKLKEAGYQVLAISPEKPDYQKKDQAEMASGFTLLSDAPARVIKAFGLAFRVDDATVERYKGFGADLEARAGLGHHILPVPAAYVIGRDGKIEYAYSNPDYKERIDAQKLLAEAMKLKEQ